MLEAHSEEVQKVLSALAKAEERILFPEGKVLKASLCGETVELRPLPIKWAKQLSARLSDVIKQFGEEDKKKLKAFQEKADIEIVDALLDCMVIMAQFYELEDVERESIEKVMSVTEVKALVLAQAQINEDDDFLLMPLQAIIGVLSQATSKAQEVRETGDSSLLEPNLSSTQQLPKSGELVSIPSLENIPEVS